MAKSQTTPEEPPVEPDEPAPVEPDEARRKFLAGEMRWSDYVDATNKS
jgi:hypothetical protein